MSKSYIVCNSCGHYEEVNKHLFFKILGGVISGGGFYAWVTYLFAGTGLAMPICIAIILGGVGIGAYSNEIAGWISKKYNCPMCNARSWTVEKNTIVSKQIDYQQAKDTVEYLEMLSKYARNGNKKHIEDYWYKKYWNKFF